MGPGCHPCPGQRACQTLHHLIYHSKKTQSVCPACPTTTLFSLSLPHTLPVWSLLKLINQLIGNVVLEAEGLGPWDGSREALPRFWFLGQMGMFSAPLQKSSVAPATASPSVCVLAVLALREPGRDLLIQGTRSPAVLMISDVQATGQVQQHQRARAMPSACLGCCRMSHCPSACGSGADGDPGGHPRVRASLSIWGA